MTRPIRRTTQLLVLAALAAATGCGAPSSQTAQLTYYKDVKPIIDARCNGCHAAGMIAPQTLETYKQVTGIAGAIDKDVMTGTMPPWPPGPGCQKYVGNRALPAAEKKTLHDWIQGDMAEGTKGTGTPIKVSDPTRLDRVDLTLTMPTAYLPHLKPDEYRCFILKWPETTTKYVTGFRIKPGAQQEVHHVIAYTFPAKDAAKIQALDDADPGPGYTCFGDAKGPEQDTSIMGVWAAGGIDKKFPAGVGIRMDPGTVVVLQVHYHTDRPDLTPDQSAIQLELADQVDREGEQVLFTNFSGWIANNGMDIPAGQADVEHQFAVDPTPYMGFLGNGPIPANHAFAILSVALHMHELGTHATTDIQRADGSDTCLLNIPHWDFDNQDSFLLQNEVDFQPGDKLDLDCHWNNTQANQPLGPDGKQRTAQEVWWGNGSYDEMCLSYYLLACPKDDPTCSK